MDDHIKLKRAENGFMVCATDPAIVESNQKADRWKDPDREYVFETLAAALKFVEAIAEKALPKDSSKDPFADAFAKAATEDK